MSLVVEKFADNEPAAPKEFIVQRLRKHFLALPLEKKAIIRKYAERYGNEGRCEFCNHDFPDHWAGCRVVRDQLRDKPRPSDLVA